MIRFFQIGFSECEMTAFCRLFYRAGVKSLHSSGRFWRGGGPPAVKRRNARQVFLKNVLAGRPALDSLEDSQAFLT